MSESVFRLSSRRLVALALAVGALVSPPSAQAREAASVVGVVDHVVDGDTLDIGGTRVRLEGIDAPELGQRCGRAWFGTWACGAKAQGALYDLVVGKTVTCSSVGQDKYGRVLGLCSLNGVDINKAMVGRGLAWAFVKYSDRYVADEAQARAAKAGVWQGEATAPWEFRAEKWAGAEQTSPNGCAIKGNVTENGHIYHMPWSPWYGKVKVEPAKGEQWFCSEAEAQSAGFRSVISH